MIRAEIGLKNQGQYVYIVENTPKIAPNTPVL
jgi:hypothetical protein